MANALLLLAEILVAFLLGASGGLFFGLVVVTRVIDITLTDGARRGAINAAYQALPASQRVTVQTGVEGIAAPLALGLTGVVLLILTVIDGVTIVHVAVLTLLITLLWLGSANRMYRYYADALRQTLRRRALDKAELTLEDSTSLAVVERFLQSDDRSQIHLALDALESAEHETLNRQLIALLDRMSPFVRAEALARIERLGIEEATSRVDYLARTDPDPVARGAALRALCALQEAGAVDLASSCLHEPAPEIRLGAAVGLLRYGGIAGVLNAGAWLADLQASADPADRRLLAQILGQVAAHNYYQPLPELLVDHDWQVRVAALDAAGQVRHARLLPLVVDNLAGARTRSAATAALIAYGRETLPYADEALSSADSSEAPLAGRMARICGQIGQPEAIEVLKKHLGHENDEVRYHVLSALRAAGYRVSSPAEPAITTRLRQESERGAQLLMASHDIGQGDEVGPLQRAFEDELDRVRQRVFLLLCLVYEPRAVMRAGEQLSSSAASSWALALEMLDVTLIREHKGLVMPLVTPDLSPDKRLEAYGKVFELPSLSREERLCRLVEEPCNSGHARWQQIGAMYAAGRLGLVACLPAIEAVASTSSMLSDDYPLWETVVWSWHALAPERFTEWAAQLSYDENPRLHDLAHTLAG